MFQTTQEKLEKTVLRWASIAKLRKFLSYGKVSSIEWRELVDFIPSVGGLIGAKQPVAPNSAGRKIDHNHRE